MPIAWTQLRDYQKERILTVFQPERDPSGYGYQVRRIPGSHYDYVATHAPPR